MEREVPVGEEEVAHCGGGISQEEGSWYSPHHFRGKEEGGDRGMRGMLGTREGRDRETRYAGNRRDFLLHRVGDKAIWKQEAGEVASPRE